jgi:sulfite reductase alpha subunit
MAKKKHDTPLLDQLETGPWPSFVSGLKRLADDEDKPYANMMKDLLGQLEHSYETRLGYWKGGTVSIFGYGGGIIPRFSEVPEDYPASKEFHTLRVQPPAGMHYSTDLLRKMCDVWEEHGSGLIALHGQSGDIMFQGCTTENVQKAFDALNDPEIGLDLGGAGPALRTSISCVGHARCEHSCFDEVRAHRSIINEFLGEMHRPALPYKFKFKFSGCANDCSNAIHRSDFAVIGTWRDDINVDQDEVKAYVARNGRKQVIDEIITMCPTRALSLNDDDTLDVDNKSCVRCMHCINAMTKALSPGDDRGEKLTELAETVIDFFAENALEHERVGETIDRIGLANFLDAIGVGVDPNMVNHPRTSSYVKTDDWDVEARKWFDRKAAKAGAEAEAAE